VMSGATHTFDPTQKPGITILASLSTEENAKTKSGTGSEPKIKDVLTKPELVGQFGRAGSDVFNVKGPAKSEAEATDHPKQTYPGKDTDKGPDGKTVKEKRDAYVKQYKNPVSEDIKGVKGSNKATLSWTFVGSFIVQFASNNVQALVDGDAVLESSR